MKKIISALENNLFSNVLIKKGLNIIEDDIYKKLCSDKQFKIFLSRGYIKPEAEEKEKNYEDMSYQELKRYVQKNNIKVNSFKRVDILEALKDKE